MKLLKKDLKNLTVGESLIYIVLVVLVSMLFVPISFGAIALCDEDNRVAVVGWFIDRWHDVKDFFSNLFTR